MPRATPKRRLRLFKQQKGLCHWCGKQCRLINGGKWMFTVDHLIHRMDPIRKTPGWQRQQRTVGACVGCNRRRGDQDQARFSKLAAAS